MSQPEWETTPDKPESSNQETPEQEYDPSKDQDQYDLHPDNHPLKDVQPDSPENQHNREEFASQMEKHGETKSTDPEHDFDDARKQDQYDLKTHQHPMRDVQPDSPENQARFEKLGQPTEHSEQEGSESDSSEGESQEGNQEDAEQQQTEGAAANEPEPRLVAVLTSWVPEFSGNYRIEKDVELPDLHDVPSFVDSPHASSFLQKRGVVPQPPGSKFNGLAVGDCYVALPPDFESKFGEDVKVTRVTRLS